MFANEENENQSDQAEKEMKLINTEIKKCLDKLNVATNANQATTSKDENKTLRSDIALCYFKRGFLRLEPYKDFLGSMYDLTLSLQYNVTSYAFFQRGILFARLEFFEQARDDFQSCLEYSTNEKHRQMLRDKITQLGEIIESSQ